MAVTDLWHYKNRQPCPLCRAKTAGTPTKRHGSGLRWRVVVGDHPTRLFAGKTDAEAWEQHLKARVPDRDTVGGLLDRWLATKADLEPATITRATMAAQQARRRWGPAAPSTIERADVQAWIAGMQAWHGTKTDGALAPASHSSKIKALQALAAALDIAVDNGTLTRNPARGLRIARDDKAPLPELDVDDVARLAARCEGFEAMVWLLCTTGVRPKECERLNVGDVLTSRGRLKVRKTKARRGREVPIPASVIATLDLDRDADQPLFRGVRGVRVNTTSFLRHVLHPAARSLEEIVTYSLRHVAATWMIDGGASVKEVQASLGHAQASTTLDVYADRFDRRRDDVARRLERKIRSKIVVRSSQPDAD
jgi:integrase